ncbi:hypothetical protein BGX34_007667 [Mortierella sp. NVP85]|nr:hypothetical protein BGX34_007667 [Mortierella sp. NVP85]
MGHVHITIPPEPAAEREEEGGSSMGNTTSQRQEALTDDPDEDDEEQGCFHCREECSSGTTGRIVAVYRPGRPANRARDRPAMSRRLEIFAELGERCETAMMLMCMRLDDLFMSIPAQKKTPLMTTRLSPDRDGGGGGGESSQDAGTNVLAGEGGTETNDTRDPVGHDQNGPQTTIMKTLLGNRNAWKTRVKWIVAAILIVVVLVLVLKPKSKPKPKLLR